MAGRLLGIVAQRVAAMLRRMARALDALQENRALDAATEALRARFPGAPEHWLRYIAARAPALAVSESVDAQGRAPSASEHYDPASDLRLGAASIRRTAPLKLARKAVRIQQERLVAETVPAMAKKPGADAPGWSERIRPKLRVVRSEFSAGDNTVGKSPDNAERKATRVRPTERNERDAPAETLVPSPGHVRPEEPVAQTPAKPGPRASASHAGAPSWFAFPWPARPKEPPQSPMQRIGRAPESRDLASREWSEPPQTMAHALLLRPTVTAQRIDRFERLFGAAAPRNAAAPVWSIEDARSSWPELPPPTDDVEPMPVTLPNLERLRSEQDRSAWSG